MQKNEPKILSTGNWVPKNRMRLNKLIQEKSFQDNYAVFDWDFTSIFYDTQDNIFTYQLENLKFKLNPKEFATTIRSGTPQNIPFLNSPSIEGKKLTAADLSKDLDERYSFLYKNYEGLNGNEPLKKIRLTEEYIDFKAKMWSLASNCFKLGGPDLCQALSTGFTIAELEKVAEDSINKGIKDEIKIHTIQSSSKLKGRAGMVQTEYRTGIRIQYEMADLFTTLQTNGIKVYICTASQTTPVRVFASNPKYPYGVKPDAVFGRKRILKDGKLSDEYDMSIPATQKEGKAKTIENLIAPNHNNKAPVLIAGDSDGDFYMMDKYKDNAVILIIEREKAPKYKISKFIEEAKARQSEQSPNYLFQYRDENKGCFSSKAITK